MNTMMVMNVIVHLGEDDGDDGLGVNERGVAQIVEAARREDLSASLEPHWLPEGNLVCQQLWGDTAQCSQHRPASMDQLDLAIPAPTSPASLQQEYLLSII
jgi:hypothetical protein